MAQQIAKWEDLKERVGLYPAGARYHGATVIKLTEDSITLRFERGPQAVSVYPYEKEFRRSFVETWHWCLSPKL